MKGIVFTGMSGYQNFPSISNSSGTMQVEDSFAYAKRDSTGVMRRFRFIGQVVRFDCRWAVLTAEQYERLRAYIRGKFFKVTFVWQGEQVEKDFYSGNISATPFRLDSSGNPKYYIDVTVPIISKESL